MSLPVLTKETASEEARPLLEKVQKKFGFVPNLIAVMTEAPPLAEAYITLSSLFDKTSFSPQERVVVLFGASVANSCEYCMAAHSMSAKQAGLPEDILEAIRSRKELPDSKLDALFTFTRVITETRGQPSQEQIAAFKNAGWTDHHLLEVILGVGLKTLSNYTNHLADTPLDDAFSKATWSKDQ